MTYELTNLQRILTHIFSVSKVCVQNKELLYFQTKNNKLRGFSPQTNYTDRATAACRRS
jgi:hypothetical protein